MNLKNFNNLIMYFFILTTIFFFSEISVWIFLDFWFDATINLNINHTYIHTNFHLCYFRVYHNNIWKTVWIKNKYVSKLLTANETALNLIPQRPTSQPAMTCFHCVPEADGYLDKTHHSFQPPQTESSFHRSRTR